MAESPDETTTVSTDAAASKARTDAKPPAKNAEPADPKGEAQDSGATPEPTAPAERKFSGAQLVRHASEILDDSRDWLVKAAFKHAGIADDHHLTRAEAQAVVDAFKAREVS